MRPYYSLLDEPWLTAVTLTGEHTSCGIRQVLQQAHTMRALTDASPLVEYGLYRLLCVLLMDALRPQELEDLEELLDKGQFDAKTLEQYYTRCEQEGCTFDLFDPERPFLQASYRPEWDKAPKPVCVLDVTIPSGNNHTHFDHRENEKISFSYAQAARLLPAVQMFCTAAAQGYPSGPNGAPPYYALVQGDNLFEILVLSMIDMDTVRGQFDRPPILWRSTIEIEPKRVVPETSWLYGMLFPARRVLLLPDEQTQTVSRVYFSQGMNYIATQNWTDPHVTYRFSDKGRFAWRPNQERPVWRNLNTLLKDDKKSRPRTLEQFTALKPGKRYVSVVLYGVQTEQASYIDVMRYDLKIPTAALQHPDAAALVETCIKLSEDLASVLRASLTHEDLPPAVASEAEQAYYDDCERRIWQICGEIPADTNADLQPFLLAWIEDIAQFARQQYTKAIGQILLRGTSLLAVTQRQGLLMAKIHKIRKEHGLCGNSKNN